MMALSKFASKPFAARYLGKCAGCPENIYPGSLARFDKGDLCHAECVSTYSQYERDRQQENNDDREPEVIVTGVRPLPLCPHCHCQHRGECF